MIRPFERYIPIEVFVLCVLELGLSFAAIYALLLSGAVYPAMPSILQSQAADLAAVLTFTIAATSLAIGLYRPEIITERRRFLANAAVAAAVAFPAMLVVSTIFDIDLSHIFVHHSLLLLKVLVAWAICLLVTRWIFGLVLRLRLFQRSVLVVGTGDRAVRASEAVRSQRARFFELAGLVTDPAPEEATEAVRTKLRENRLWGIVVAPEAGAAIPAAELMRCKLSGVRVIDDVTFREQQLGRIDLDHVDTNWFLFADGFAASRFADTLRRIGDIVLSLMFLVFTLPLMLVTALAIKFESAGPVFYRQERVGLGGRRFTLTKFRSMRTDAEAQGPVWAAQKDPRITRVGAFIRCTRIDELPQLLNVLRGEMSFIGPRPERPHFVQQLSQVVPFYQERCSVKPGITGWAQVNYPYGASVEDARAKLSYDLYYIKNRSLLLDLIILVATVRVILFQEGAR